MKKKGKIGVILCILGLLLGTTVFAAEDPYFIKQWYLQTIKAEEAWTMTTGSESVIVAVLDTGVDTNHPDIKENIWINTDEIPNDGVDNDKNGYIDDINGWDFIKNVASPQPKITKNALNNSGSHGTFVAGLISAVHNNGMGIKGVTAKVKIMPLIVLDTEGYGWSAQVAEAIDYAVANGASVVNLSFGGAEHSERLKKSIINAYDKNVLIVAAAGNTMEGGLDLTNDPLYPICYDQGSTENRVLGVIATDKNNRIAAFSNYGKDCADIAAPGVDMTSLLYQDSLFSQYLNYFDDGWQGNSFSTALVSGAAALLKSYQPTVKVSEIRDLLIKESGIIFLSDPKFTDKAGGGVLNIKKALDKLALAVKLPIVNPPENIPTTDNQNNITQNISGAQLIVATKTNGKGVLRVYDNNFQFVNELKIFSGDIFHGLNFQLVDVNNDQAKEIVAGAVKGDEPFVRVLDFNGTLLSSFFPFPDKFRGGINVTAGDVDGDGSVEIIVAPDSGFDPIVKIYNQAGQLKKQFLAFDKTYKNGLEVVAGDVDGDGKIEIVVAPHKGSVANVKIFDGQGKLKKTIPVFSSAIKGGVNLTLGDVNKDGTADIVVATRSDAPPRVRAFDFAGKELLNLTAYAKTFKGGVSIRVADWNNDGKMEIITAPGAGGGPHVKVFSLEGNLLSQFFPLANKFTSGINIDIK
jgi:hypothetical protein